MCSSWRRPGGVGAELIDHVDYVMFTGSTEVGKKVDEAHGLAPEQYVN